MRFSKITGLDFLFYYYSYIFLFVITYLIVLALFDIANLRQFEKNSKLAEFTELLFQQKTTLSTDYWFKRTNNFRISSCLVIYLLFAPLTFFKTFYYTIFLHLKLLGGVFVV